MNEKLTENREEIKADGSAPAGDDREKYDYKMTSFGEKAENFWYHYKWHTVVAVVVAVLLAILVGQFVSAPKYDVNIAYAGGYRILKLRTNGEPAPFEVALKSLCRVADDFDENGEISVSFTDKYILTAEEMLKLDSEGKGDTYNAANIKSDYDDLSSIIMTGDCCVLLLSEELYCEYYEIYDGALFVDLTPYLGNTSEPEFVGTDKKGIRLSTLPFSELPEINNLPSDTVLCLRTLSQGPFGTGGNTEQFKRAEQVIRNIISFK